MKFRLKKNGAHLAGGAALFCLTALALIVLLKQYLPVYAAVASLAAVLGLLVVISGWLAPFLHWIQTLPDFPQSENFKYLLKAAGIVLVSQCLQELCRDAGQGALAYAADLAGRFTKNFVKYTGNDAGKALVEAGPKL